MLKRARLAVTLALAGGLVASGALGVTRAFAQGGARPDDGVTQGQPFVAGTGGSAKFRIPAMVTLDDGTIVAATDARWNTTGDGGGLDTIVSRSTDGGATWNYTFANYLGDNGNVWNGSSTAFIDPALATDGQTTWMVVDLFPAGIALNSASWTPQVGAGFDDAGHLRLRDAGQVEFGCSYYSWYAAAASYDYYLDLDTLTIHKSSDRSEVEGYTVDGFFNITDSEGKVTNLFCGDAPFQVFPTDYLYLTKSTDGGATWSEPTLIDVKDDDEQTLLVGPGTGTVLEDGTLMFSVYEHTSGRSELASVIYSKDDGKTWTRSSDATSSSHWSSEAVTVPLDNDTVRQFYRDGMTTLYYTDYDLKNDVWTPGQPVDSGEVKTSGNQLSAIRYSKKINGKDAVIVSMASSGSGARTDGKLHVGLINDDQTITWQYVYDMVEPGGSYSYSTLAELENGDIAVLYENSGGTELFEVVPFADLVRDETNVDMTVTAVDLVAGEQAVLEDPSGDYTTADISELDTSVATLKLEQGEPGAPTVKPGNSSGYTGAATQISDCLYTFTKSGSGFVISAKASDGSTVYCAPGISTSAGFPNSATSSVVTLSAGYEANTVYLQDTTKGSYLYFDKSSQQLNRVNTLNNNVTWMKNCSWYLYRAAAAGEASSKELPGYVKVENPEAIEGGSYLIVSRANNGSDFVLYPTFSVGSVRDQVAQVSAATTSTTVLTFTGIATGTTSVHVGATRYDVTVADYHDQAVSVEMGKTVEVTDATGDFSGQVDEASFDKGIAGYEVKGADGATTISFTGIMPGATTLIVGTTRYTVTVPGEVVEVDQELGSTWSTTAPGAVSSDDLGDYDKGVIDVKLSATDGAVTGSAPILLEDTAYTFTKGEDGSFTVSGTTSDGEVVYLAPGTNGPGFPSATGVASITVTPASGRNGAEGLFNLRDSGRYLYYKNGAFDRVSSPSGFEDGCTFKLYRAVDVQALADGEGGAIEGYEQVMSIDDVTDGTYLIVAANAADGELPVLHPSTSTTSKPAHVAYVKKGGATQADVTLTAVGTTGLRLGNQYVHFTVRAPRFTVTLDPAGGVVEQEAVEVVQGEPYGELPIPTRDGYEFQGWFDAAGNQVGAETVFEGGADATLTAQWKKAETVQPGPGTGDTGNTGGAGNTGNTGSADNAGGTQKPTAQKPAKKGGVLPKSGDTTNGAAVAVVALAGAAALTAGVIVQRRKRQ